MKYVELRGHSQFSVGFAAGTLDEYVARTKELESDTICLTERDSMRGVFDVHKIVGEKSVKAVYGVEIALVDDHTRRSLTEEELSEITDKKVRDRKRAISRAERRLGVDRFPMIALRALNDEGVTNLYRLTSKGWLDGHYRNRPRIDRDILEAHAAGLSVSVGGVNGFGLERIWAGDSQTGVASIAWLSELFEGRCYFELRPHAGEDVKLNPVVVRLAETFDVPLIATNDVRYVNPNDTTIHELVMCMQRARMTMKDPDRPRSATGYHIRGAEEMLGAFSATHPSVPKELVAEAIERTVEVAALHVGKPRVEPLRGLIPQIDGVEDPRAELRRLCMEGMAWRDIEGRAQRRGVKLQEYNDQLMHEFKTLEERNMEPYFLIVRDVINWCRQHRIFVGPGRGSSAGSLVCFLLGITAVDPLEHGLMFERFLAPGRVDMPDIDTDFSKVHRDQVIEYIRQKYGADRVAHIGTHGEMHGKGAIRNVCRVMDVPVAVAGQVTNTFSSRQGDEEIPVREVLETFDSGVAFMNDYPDVLDYIERLQDTVNQVGVHASGILVSPVPLPEVCPVEHHLRNGVGTTISALDMDGVSGLGLLKLDVLGLRNLDVLDDVRSAVWERHGIEIDFESLTFDDQKVIDGFTRQEFAGVFQYDADSARSVCAGLTFNGFQDVVALTALNRPGCTRSGLTETFRQRRMDPSNMVELHPIYDEITKDTLGVLVYQEQLIKAFRIMAGFTPEHADKMRKIIGKKLGEEEMEKHRSAFVEGSVKNGVPEDDANLVFDMMLKSASYAFNIAHATVYAAIGYWEMWCKVYYPVEFVWALMNRAKDQKEAAGYVNEARRLGIKILGPDVNESGASWTIVGENTIRAGLRGITSVGPGAVEAIVESQPFRTASDFFERVKRRAVNSRVVENLIRAGAMRSLFPSTKWALEHQREWKELASSREGTWASMLDGLVWRDAEGRAHDEYDEIDLRALAFAVCPQGNEEHPITIYDHLFEEGGPLHGMSDVWLDMDDDSFYKDGRCGFVRGMVSDVMFKTVGDHGGGSKLDDEEKELKGWGRRFAVVTLQTALGVERRVTLHPDAFERWGDVVGRKNDRRCVAIHVDVRGPPWRSVKGHYVVDLEAIRQKSAYNIPLTRWEMMLTKEGNPLAKWSTKPLARRRSSFDAAVLVTSVREVRDRNGNRMAFFVVQDGAGGAMEAVSFSSTWSECGQYIRPGAMVSCAFKKEGSKKKMSLILDDRGVIGELGQMDSTDLLDNNV